MSGSRAALAAFACIVTLGGCSSNSDSGSTASATGADPSGAVSGTGTAAPPGSASSEAASSATPVTQTPTNGTFPEGSAATIAGTKHVAIAYTTHVFWPKAMTTRAGGLDVDPAATFGQFVPVKGGAALAVNAVATSSTAMWLSDDAVVATNELSACHSGCAPLKAPASARYLWILTSDSSFVLPAGTPASVSLSNAEAPENHASDGATSLQP